ncbi:MAG: M50 family metallopeptidase [Holosporaceae bacterium]|jgi:regulator of sigma E protease|nr:M50 family metallopeptidase [Holosporaceae bacterium]
MSIFHYLFSFFFVINIIVFVHEYGHFLAAKRVGVKVLKFSIGIGPEICGINDKHGTRWCFSLFPIGGYVMMQGDGDIASATEDEESLKDMTAEDSNQSIITKSNWEKMLVAFCGPFFNYIYAFVVVAGLAFFYGAPVYDTTIANVLTGSPAEKAGLLVGDKIIAVAGQKVDKYSEVIRRIKEEAGKIDFLIERNGIQEKISISPEIKETKMLLGGVKKNKIVGIHSGSPVFVKKSLRDSIKFAVLECVNATKEMCMIFARLFAGKKSLDEFGGVVRMAEVAGNLSQSGSFALLIMFTVTLSLNLGFINLFPLPILDGGKILISFVEQITGKKLNKALQEYVMMACAALLIFLMLVMTVNDVLRLEVVNRFVSNIIG